jgi:hypothetical protein
VVRRRYGADDLEAERSPQERFPSDDLPKRDAARIT